MSKKHSTLSPTLLKVLEITKLGVPVSPTQINDHIGKGNYAAKHVLYLKILGYDFSVTKSGRNVVAYTLIKEPANAAALVANATNKTTKTKTAKAPKTVKLSTIVNKVSKNFAAKKAAEAADNVVDIDAVKAKNLETMRKVAAKMKAKKAPKAKKVREFDDVTETFGTSGEVGTSFSVERDWDSVEGLDLKNLL